MEQLEPPWARKPTAAWRGPSLLPAHLPGSWGIWDRGREREVSFAILTTMLRRWQPQSMMFVASPDDDRYNVPVSIGALAPFVDRGMRRRAIVGVSLSIAAAVICLVWWFALPSRVLIAVIYSLGLGATLIAVDHWIALRSPVFIDERARFLYWLRSGRASKLGATFWILVLGVIGIGQLALVVKLGGQDAVFEHVGATYVAMERGEWWRVASGAFLHYSLLHFLNNFFLLLLAGTLTWATMGAHWSIGVFLLGNVVGVVGQMLLGGSAYDSTGGVSFGIYSLLGLAAVSGRGGGGRLPHGFGVLLVLIAAIGVGASELGSAASATAGHLCGLATGALCGLGEALPTRWRAAAGRALVD